MKNKNLAVIALIIFLLLIIGATYAYFAAQRGDGSSADINVEAGTTDSLTFTKDTDINISANADNFKQSGESPSGQTNVTAHLVANNTTNEATETYNVYFNIMQNEFVYAKDTNPELILQITDSDDKEIIELPDKSIKYVTVNDASGVETPIKGFDITTTNGLITIKTNQEIKVTDGENENKVDQEWKFKIIFINHNYDQQVNTGKVFQAQAVMSRNPLPTVDVETINVTSDSMKVIATISNYEKTVEKVEFQIDDSVDNEWHQATDDSENIYSHTFDSLTSNKKYNVKTKVTYENSEELLNVISESTTAKKTIADACPRGGNLADCLISLYNKNSTYEDTKLYFHNGTMDGQDANDLSYRFTGGDFQLTQKAKNASYSTINDIIKLDCNGTSRVNSNDYCATNPKYTLSYNQGGDTYTTLKSVLTKAIADGYISDNNIKNFVCFGGDCSNVENLYRIIGAFKVDDKYQIKLVKADEAGTDLLGEDGDFARLGTAYNTYLGNHSELPRYTWDKNGKNVWSNSELNTKNLNETYLGKLGPWADMITETSWQVGGMTYQNAHEQGARTAYENELGSLKNSLPHQAKIGLMYVSDYYYGATKDRWSLPGFVFTVQDYRLAAWDNWTWIGDNEWFITPRTDKATCAFGVLADGYVTAHTTTLTSLAVRPSFYLNSNVMYVRGEGISDNPIILG